MAHSWVRCTTLTGASLYINLDQAVHLTQEEDNTLLEGGFTLIAMPGAKDGFVKVRETPDEILAALKEARYA